MLIEMNIEQLYASNYEHHLHGNHSPWKAGKC